MTGAEMTGETQLPSSLAGVTDHQGNVQYHVHLFKLEMHRNLWGCETSVVTAWLKVRFVQCFRCNSIEYVLTLAKKRQCLMSVGATFHNQIIMFN